jgi:hypothetical protein
MPSRIMSHSYHGPPDWPFRRLQEAISLQLAPNQAASMQQRPHAAFFSDAVVLTAIVSNWHGSDPGRRYAWIAGS